MAQVEQIARSQDFDGVIPSVLSMAGSDSWDSTHALLAPAQG